MLWNVRIQMRKKLALIAIFSVTIVVMVVSIIRVTVVHSANENVDISWLYFWSNIEMNTGTYSLPSLYLRFKLILALLRSYNYRLYRIVPPIIR